MPERSFCVRGKRFPVCARCTGAFIGNISAFALFFIYTLPLPLCLIGCGVIFVDWLIQHLGIRESTNTRRLITGIIGGYAVTTIYCSAIKYAVLMIAERIF
jgi:uncharacterized membrane protein